MHYRIALLTQSKAYEPSPPRHRALPNLNHINDMTVPT